MNVRLSPFGRRVSVLQYVLRANKGVSITEILDNSLVEINQGSMNNLLKRLVRDGYLQVVGKSTYTHYYCVTDKTRNFLKI